MEFKHRGHWAPLILAGCLVGGSAAALDLGPLDGIAPPAGVTGVSIELAERTVEGALELQGTALPTRIERQSVNLRFGHGFEIGGMPAYGYGELPMVDFSVDSTATDLVDVEAGSGVGDLALALAVWPYADPEAGRFLGVAGYLIAPTGEYDADKTVGVNLNPGNNRFAGIIQAGFQQRLTDQLEWNIAADVMVFEDNDEFIGDRVEMTMTGGAPALVPQSPATLEVEPYISYQTSLAWRLHPAVTLATSYYIDRGAEFRIDGDDWSDSVNRERYGLWGLFTLGPGTRLNVSYKGPVNDRSDLELQESVQIRLVQFF